MLALLLPALALAGGCRPSDPTPQSAPAQAILPAEQTPVAQPNQLAAAERPQPAAVALGPPVAAGVAAAVADPVPKTQATAVGALAALDPSANCGVPRASAPVTLDLYKHDIACRIHARNGEQIYQGAPPPVLRSVVVLTVRIDATGRPVQITVRRSNGIRNLERRAIQSVRLASPLPVPSAAMLKRGSTDITETWLFRDDGRFQVRTLAMVQAKSGY